MGFLGVLAVKNLPIMQETWVQSLSQEDPFEKEIATHSSILAREIPWTEEPGGLHDLATEETTKTTTQHLTHDKKTFNISSKHLSS